MAGISYEELIKQGATPVQPTGGVSFEDLQGQGATPYQAPQPQPKVGLWDKLKQRGSNILQQIKPSSYQDRTAYQKVSDALGGRMVKVAGNVIGAAGDIAGAGIEAGAKAIYNKLPEQKQESLKRGFSEIVQNPLVGAGITALQQGMEKYDEFKQSNPNASQDIEALANILSVIPVGRAGKSALGTAKEIKTGVQKIRGAAPIEKSLSSAIDEGIEKGIKPTVVGKKNITQLEQYKEKARTAVKTIVQNKDKIKLADEFGEITGKLPQTLKQFSDAIDQTKKQIYKKYDELAQKAGKAGASVDLTPISKELSSLTKSPVMQDIAPEVVGYAQKRGEALIKRGKYTTKQAQEAIEQLNKSLESFYKNPSASEFSKLQIDALIVNNLRKSLDTVIENTTEKGYQALKNIYGSLKTIEKDVAKRAIVDARKNAKGLIDFTDIFSAGDIVAGVASFNPALVGKGVFQKAVASLYKMRNDPNRIIKKMFEGAEKSLKKIEEVKKPFEPKSKILKSRAGLNIEDISKNPKVINMLKDLGYRDTYQDFVQGVRGKYPEMEKELGDSLYDLYEKSPEIMGEYMRLK